MMPTLFGSSVAQVNLLFDTIVATFLLSGSVTWLYFTDRLLEFPLGMFGVAHRHRDPAAPFGRHAATDPEGFSKGHGLGPSPGLLIGVPACIGLVLLRRAALQRRCSSTASSLPRCAHVGLEPAALALGLPAFLLVKVLAPGFYARQDTRTPVKAAVVSLLANVLFTILLLGGLLYLTPLGEAARAAANTALAATAETCHKGISSLLPASLIGPLSRIPGAHACLALASALAGWLNAGQLWWYLRRDRVFHAQPGWRRFSLQLLVASVAMVIVLWLLLSQWQDWSTWPTRRAPLETRRVDRRGAASLLCRGLARAWASARATCAIDAELGFVAPQLYFKAMNKLFRDVDGGPVCPGGSVVCIGAFDGLHLGHRALVRHAVERARALDVPAIALSFEPLPREFFGRQAPPPRLSLPRAKFEGLRALAADAVGLLRFDARLAAMPPQAFIDTVLRDRLSAREVWVGPGFRFGHARAGDLATLRAGGELAGFSAGDIEPVHCRWRARLQHAHPRRVARRRFRECCAPARPPLRDRRPRRLRQATRQPLPSASTRPPLRRRPSTSTRAPTRAPPTATTSPPTTPRR